jgi:hypothetical protein
MEDFDWDAFVEESKMFESTPITDYYELTDTSNTHSIIPYGKNIMLIGKFKSFKGYDNDTLDFMRYFIYSNEDYMYAAYDRYNIIKNKWNAEDDEMACMYIEDETDIAYYKKALILMNKANVVMISSKNLSKPFQEMLSDYNVQVVWDDNIYVRFILMSLFKHNICQYNDPFYSIWSAYISRYDELKTVILPDYVKPKMNDNINNMNILYLNASD